jgi:hypothetical protein
MLTLEYDPDSVLELNLDDAGRRTLIEILTNHDLIPIDKLTIQLVGAGDTPG